MNMKKSVLLSVFCLVWVSGCRLLPDSRPQVTVPVSAVGTLSTTGLDVAFINSLGVLGTIQNSSARRLVFQHEWRDAPSMTMISMGMASAGAVDPLLRAVPGLDLAPVETDFAVCDSRVVAGVQQQVPPNADGKWSSVEVGGPNGALLINRIKGEVGGVTITPVNGVGTSLSNTFNLSVNLSSLSIGLGVHNRGADDAPDGYHVDIASAVISCTAAIRREASFSFPNGMSTCGEQNVACVPGSVVLNITRPTSNLPQALNDAALLVWGFAGERAITEILENGVVLHFENFSATGLGFTSSGVLALRGASTVMPDGTSACSPNAIAPPPVPPTRGLVQTHSYDGHGETRSTDGYVRSFTLRPFMSTEFSNADRSSIYSLVRDARLYPSDAVTQMFGAEFPPIRQFDVARLTTHLRADRLDSNCWAKATSVNDLLKEGPVPVFGRFDGRFLKGGSIAKLGLREFRYSTLTQATPSEVDAAMNGLGMSCGDCTGYWRMDGIVGAPDYPTTWPMPDDGAPFDFDVPPYLGQLWFHEDPSARLNRLLACDDKFHEVKDEVVIALPQVRLFDSLFDSERENSMGYAVKGSNSFAEERTFTYQGQTNRMIVMQEDCWARGATSCWESDLLASDAFTVAAYGGASGTTIPRLGVRAAVRANSVASYGVGAGSPWGFFDRSQLDVFSAVPAEYAQAGVTSTAWDWRGHLQVDWAHDSAFPAPSAQSRSTGLWHDAAQPTDWWGVSGSTYFTHLQPSDPPDDLIAYRPSFQTDRLLLRRRAATERSFCVAEGNLMATMDQIRFQNQRTTREVFVPANEIFPANANGQVQVIGTSTSSGTTGAYFNH